MRSIRTCARLRENGTRYFGMSPHGEIADPHRQIKIVPLRTVNARVRSAVAARWNFRARSLYSDYGIDVVPREAAMHSHSIDQWTHEHVFLGSKHARHERRTWFVVALTSVMMVGEITVGWLSGSMALLADGWHMATHAAALGIAALAYLFARRQAGNSHFSFGTGKFGDLAAFSSAIILTMIAVQIAYESAYRLFHP